MELLPEGEKTEVWRRKKSDNLKFNPTNEKRFEDKVIEQKNSTLKR